MPLLKLKISRALQKREDTQEPKLEPSDSPLSYCHYNTNTIVKSESSSVSRQEVPKKSVQAPPKSPKKKEPQSNKNIVKNYARAMINFASSTMAQPYIEKILKEDPFDVPSFRRFIKGQKEDINSIKKLRELLLIEEGDTERIAAIKRAFRRVSEVFVKLFSVNWIFNSKISDKVLHLNYRFKILRRIRNPEHFTYLENFNKTK